MLQTLPPGFLGAIGVVCLVAASLACGGTALQPNASLLLPGDVLLFDYQRWQLLTADTVRTGGFPLVPSNGRFARVSTPLELRATRRDGLRVIGPTRSTGSPEDWVDGTPRIFHLGARCGRRDLGPWPPAVAGLRFEEPFLAADLSLIAWRDDAVVSFDPATGVERVLHVPAGLDLANTSHHAHWLDVTTADEDNEAGFVAQIGSEAVHVAGGVEVGRYPLTSDEHQMLASHTRVAWAALATNGSGLVVDHWGGKVRTQDLASGKTPPKNARLMFYEGAWNPFGEQFVYWSSERSGCASNGYACNEVFDLVSFSTVTRNTEVLLPFGRPRSDGAWAFTTTDVFDCLEPTPL